MWGTRAGPCLQQALRRGTQNACRTRTGRSQDAARAKCRLLHHNVASVATTRQLHWTPGHSHGPQHTGGGSLRFPHSATCGGPDLGSRLCCNSHKSFSTSTIGRSAQNSQEGHSGKVKVLYDGHCPLCVKEIELLVWKNKTKQTLEFVDISRPGYDPGHHAGVTYSQAMDVMHVIGSDGQVHTRIGAMQAMYGALGWGWLWSWTNLPLVGPLADRAYDWFARNRLWLTGRDCDTGTCNVKTKPKGDSKHSK